MYRQEKRGKKGLIILAAVLAAMMLAAGGAAFLWKRYTVKTVYVEGNIHYTEEEIRELVMRGPLSHNSLYLSFRYRKQDTAERIPFVDVLDVTVLSPDTIKITVYEKALAGYVKYMDSYMYFDKDGEVVECSSEKTPGVPQITGLTFEHIILEEPLPVEDETVFTAIMDITKLMKKYELSADKIHFDASGNITIYFGEVRASVGSDKKQLETKIMRLPQLLSKVEGKKGVFHMENLTEDNTNVSFAEEKQNS